MSRHIDKTAEIEKYRRHTIEDCDQNRANVQALEVRLGVKERWTPDCAEFRDAERKVAMLTYQKALDKLEGLVVGRIFELTNMNRSQMGNLSLIY